MSKKPQTPAADPFQSLDADQLTNVAGGAARVTARNSGTSSELTAMLTSIGDSIKGLASSKDSGGGDMMQMMMMMMMMGGGGSSAAAAPAPAPAPTPPVVNISTNVRRC